MKIENVTKDLTGQVFGRWTVAAFSHKDSQWDKHWLCICECGGEKIVSGARLRRGRSNSCGCLQKEGVARIRTRHGMYKHPAHPIWCGALQRVTNQNHQEWYNYGGRGIGMSQEWKDSFEAFWEDMGPTWKEGLTLDRIDVNGDYCKENCRWVDQGIQNHNRRKWKNCSSVFMGVSFSEKRSKWVSSICIKGRNKWLGGFENETDAALAYDNKSEELYGDRPNKTIRLYDVQ